MLSLGRRDKFETEIYATKGRSWYNFDENVVGCVVVGLRRPRKVGKITAQLKCVETVRTPYKNKLKDLRFHDDTIEHYSSPVLTVADMDGRTVTSKTHRYPISFTLPSDAEGVPPSYGYWYTLGGVTDWYGVKWFVELKESSEHLRCVETPLRVFPKVTPEETKSPSIQSAHGRMIVEMPPVDSLNGLQHAIPGLNHGNCQVRQILEFPSVVRAGQFPDLRLKVHADVDDLFVIQKVVLTLHSHIKMISDELISFDHRSILLAKWRTNTKLRGQLDMSEELHANLRERAIWECDVKSDTAAVKHYLNCRVFISSRFGLREENVLNISTPIEIAAPVYSDDVTETLPRYTAREGSVNTAV